MGLDPYTYQQITGGTAIGSATALATHAQDLVVINTGRDLQLVGKAAADLALTLTTLAGSKDFLTYTAALGTGTVGLHDHTHEILLGHNCSSAVTPLTGLYLGPRLCTGAGALVAVLDSLSGYILLGAEGGLLKGDLDPCGNILAPCGSVGTPTAPACATSEEAAEQVSQISKVSESIKTR